MTEGPTCIILLPVWEGLDVVTTARKMLGETNPADSLPGTIRGDFCVEVGRSDLQSTIHNMNKVTSSLYFRILVTRCMEGTFIE
uniref:Nucleoside diphosphate kinase B n=1 Tax=Labrus bergylta TaxID=56723 RepID=A0A3Q3F6R5_9LABR